MQARWIIALVLGVLVGGLVGFLSRGSSEDDAAALANLTVPVNLTYHLDVSEASEGETCTFPNLSEIADAEGRLVVRDGEGHVIAISDTVESTYEPVPDSSLLVCNAYHFVLVPESPFYDVYWGNTWLTSVALDDFPFREPIPVSLD